MKKFRKHYFTQILLFIFSCGHSNAIDLEIYKEKAVQCGENVWRASYNAIGRFVSFGATGDVLCAADGITMRLYHQMKGEFDKNEIGYIFGGLHGDDEEAALLIAQEVRRRNIRLIVDSRCSESCADYVFPAAVEKYVSARGLVIWRGGRLGRVGDRDDMPARDLGREFLIGLGVSPRLLEALPDSIARDAGFLRAREAGERPGWSWSQDSLRTLFGVDGVTIVKNDQQERFWWPRDLKRQQLQAP